MTMVRKPDVWQHLPYVTADFHGGLNEIFHLLRCFAAYNSSFVRTFRYSLSVPFLRVKQNKNKCFSAEDETVTLSRNVGELLSF